MSKTLAVLPSLTGIQRPNGRLVLAGRFMSGMAAYRRLWDGPLIALIEPEEESAIQKNRDRTLGGDNADVDPKSLDFDVQLIDYGDRRALKKAMSRADVVLAGVHYRQNHIAKLGKSVSVPVIYASEYTLATRLQIVKASVKNPLMRMRRTAWELNQERQIRAALSRSAGLQANGTPTFEAYRGLAESSLLYFDGRGTEAMLVSDADLESRLAYQREGHGLRLVFAGRLNEMKGADQLLVVARHLIDLGVPFSLDIYGGGVLAEELKATIEREQMSHAVHLFGFVPFEELMPRLGRDYDMFLCCHVQGDPSGMYLEVLGKGLPFVGYANEALAGILRRTNVGRAVATGDALGVAKAIERVATDHDTIAFWSRSAVAFGREHTFDKTFARRIEHIRALAR